MRAYGLLVAYIFTFLIGGCIAQLTKQLASTEDLLDKAYDVVIFINDGLEDILDDLPDIHKAYTQYKSVDANAGKKLQFIPFLKAKGKSLIFSPTGSLNSDTSDSRLIYNAGRAASELMCSIGKKKPLVVVGPFKSFKGAKPDWLKEPYVSMTALLGVYQGLYTPLTIRQVKRTTKYEAIGVYKYAQNQKDMANIVKLVNAVEEGRMITRDICGTDQEQMTAMIVADYITEHFTSNLIKTDISKIDALKWPTIAATNRGSLDTPYDGRIITMNYATNAATADEHLYLIGKGITFDTGGLSLKTGGSMTFMHSDKCGAASVAGFMKVIEILKPQKLSVYAKMGYVRNNIGADAYAVDEIITSKAGKRSRIGSTDAEGRNILVDLMYDAKKEINENKDFAKAHIVTIATLTGAVGQAFGKMTAIMDNGPAREAKESFKLRDAGELIGDLTEISNIRQEDYENCYAVTEYEDLQQRNTHPNTVVYRGHQYPAAWMIMASGLDEHSLTAEQGKRIKYTHMDVASSVGVSGYAMPTATPLPMLFSRYVLPEIVPKPAA